MSGPDSFDDFLAEVGMPPTGSDVDSSDDIAVTLDSAEAIQAVDRSGTLWTLATSGSQVRRAGAAAGSWTDRLADSDRPRAVLVATDPHVPAGAPLLAELGLAQVPVLSWPRAELPRWAGPADVLLATSLDGMNPRVAAVAAEADRRGLTVVLVSPEDSPVAAAAIIEP